MNSLTDCIASATLRPQQWGFFSTKGKVRAVKKMQKETQKRLLKVHIPFHISEPELQLNWISVCLSLKIQSELKLYM